MKRMNSICVACHDNSVPTARRKLGYTTCLPCGKKAASKVRHTVAPMNKGNYMLFTDMELLKQLNPKRTT